VVRQTADCGVHVFELFSDSSHQIDSLGGTLLMFLEKGRKYVEYLIETPHNEEIATLTKFIPKISQVTEL